MHIVRVYIQLLLQLQSECIRRIRLNFILTTFRIFLVMLLPTLTWFHFLPKNQSGNEDGYTNDPIVNNTGNKDEHANYPIINPRRSNVLSVIVKNKDNSREFVQNIIKKKGGRCQKILSVLLLNVKNTKQVIVGECALYIAQSTEWCTEFESFF